MAGFYEDGDEYVSDEEKLERANYNRQYTETMNKLQEGSDDPDAILDEMATMRYDPGTNPSQDAEMNFLRAEKAAKKKSKINNPTARSFIKHKMRQDGLSEAEAKKWARKAIKEGE